MSRKVFSLVLVGVVAACGGGDAGGGGAAADSAAPAQSGMERTVGAAGRAEATLKIAEMRSHLSVLEAAGGDEMVALVPQHAAMTATLLTELSASPPSNPAWIATADSIRQDLSRMQNMPANQLDMLIQEHAGRLRRLMDMYEAAPH